MLDKRQIAHAFSRAAQSYDAAAVIQHAVREEQLDRLNLLRLEPKRILDLGSGTGKGSSALSQRYKRSDIIALDLAHGMSVLHKKALPRFRNRIRPLCADQDQLPIADNSVDMIFSNLALQWSQSLDHALQECRRVLSEEGVICFTTVGPDTLIELRQAWQSVDEDQVPIHQFLDMHDIGDAMIRAGFAEPVLDVERYTLTYPNLRSLLDDLKAIGATYADAQRSTSRLTRSKLKALSQSYEAHRLDGSLPLSYEVVFVQAWQPAKSARPQDGSTVAHFPANAIKRRVG